MIEKTTHISFFERFLLGRSWWLLPLFAWTALVVWLLATNIERIKTTNMEIARNSAQNFFQIVELTRLWNAGHGGVYVPITAQTLPNRFLKIPDRDVLTTSGQKLTKINPAFMTRQLTELIELQSHVSFHITSLKPLRPQNKADTWEYGALQQFEQGVDEVFERTNGEPAEVFRYMAPLFVKKPCLKCHEVQGYQLGDIRGGISVTLDAGNLFGGEARALSVEVGKHVGVYLLLVIFVLLFLEKMRQNWLQLQYIEQQQEMVIRERTRELELLVTQDGLTGLFNRKALDDQLASEMSRSGRYHHQLSMLMLDIDYFKKVNDVYDHQAGDKVLKMVSKWMQGSIRASDFAARYGGEEFIILLPETRVDYAYDLAERLRRKIENGVVTSDEGLEIGITVSIGVAAYPDHAENMYDLVKAADKALYRAKRQGRNQVVMAIAQDDLQ
ncbi:MAG: diguanylate cyclase [Gammaproteobacteria bacterium]|nr:diguanylate cyclase [Gammaproteobacteria bacterium]